MVVINMVVELNLARRVAMFNAEANKIDRNHNNVLFGTDSTKQLKQKMIERDKMVYIIRTNFRNLDINKILSNPEQGIKNSTDVDKIMNIIAT